MCAMLGAGLACGASGGSRDAGQTWSVEEVKAAFKREGLELVVRASIGSGTQQSFVTLRPEARRHADLSIDVFDTESSARATYDDPDAQAILKEHHISVLRSENVVVKHPDDAPKATLDRVRAALDEGRRG
jgi:hypothetical protein